MKVLYCLTAYPPSVGGAQSHFHELARRLRSRHEVQVVCHWSENRMDWLRGVTVRPPETRRYTRDGVPVLQLNFDRQEQRRLAAWAWGYYFNQGPSVRRISDLLLEKLDRAVPAVDLVHAGRIGREFLAWAAYKLARKRGVPFVLTPFHHPRWGGWLHRWYLRLYRLADAVLTLTSTEKETLIRLGVPPERLHVIGHAPILPGQPPEPGYFGPGGQVVLFLGQKYRYKGVGQIVAAMPLVWKVRPETRFAFLGPETAYSQKLFKRLQDPRVIRKASVSEEEKYAALADCAVFCLPSRQESFGGVFTEAWSLGKPVIGGNIPAVSELIQEGQDGLLVDGSPQGLAEKTLLLLMNSGTGQAMGQSGKAKVQARFNWDMIRADLEKIYQELRRG